MANFTEKPLADTFMMERKEFGVLRIVDWSNPSLETATKYIY